MKVFFLTFLFCQTGFAQEYHFFSEEETIELNGPHLIGSEYQSDVLAYRKLISWYGKSIREDTYFDFTAGSLGPTRFLTDNRIHLRQSLYDNLDFKVLYIDQSSFEGIEKHFIVEFTYHLDSIFAFSIYGEPSSFKSSDDAGAAIIFKLTPNHHLRLFGTAVDFSYNKRNEGVQAYIKKPYSYGLMGRWLPKDSQDEYLQYTVRWDKKLHRFDSTDSQVYEFERSFFEIQGRYSFRPLHFINYQLSYKKGWEKDFNPAMPLPDFQWDSDHITGLIQGERGFLLAGIKTLYRQWKSNRGVVIHNDILPHAWYSFAPGKYGFWKLGYEFTWHRGQGPQALRSVLDRNDVLEHRMNLAYQWEIADKAKLIALFTADLDEFGTGETWEGGNVQFFWNF